ncbi:NAD(P)-dependent dehydrogenase (short-subunit alcohol dehydrogenase family) [Prauserella shujinwangii]|uniref:NAD(P)-dependent dehydrogenase (Short-subunit alcohol dehydrogenase family) n=1 Tax=Prauserella shujinwangii TaxID=1453103 RepID=A0A2T0LYH8_9PSEU|nr:SDR family oxidoreductase [Prauserella shujinwangii]PRX49173.1 NAD(P)-dependent dehydrogenase (short-subunit alcohol dehydrogenase family) [Prauserella shujinwangii]
MVTGASRGIGAAVARLAGRHGYRVCVNYLSSDEAAAAVVDDITAAGGEALAVPADTGRGADVERLFATVDERLGPVTALVNNAGVLFGQCRVDEVDEDRLRELLATNVTGYFLCARQAVLRMSTRYGGAGGAIVNVSSVAARLGSPGEYVDYAASKGAVDTLTVGLSREVAAEGIRVNAVRPGFVHTDIHARGGDPDRVERIAPTLPMRRGGTPEEVAEAVLWLLSPRSSYVTGTFVDLAGGR